MLEDIKEGKINIVLAYKIDRLTRSPKDFYQLIEFFEKYKVDFISIIERFDTSAQAVRLLRNIMLTFAQFERVLASERIKDNMLERHKKGIKIFSFSLVNSNDGGSAMIPAICCLSNSSKYPPKYF